ncbi:MAG TPA: GMP/IMP nucleotidase [Acidiferrobacteraceae bacterium]|nr:GMP/IMP nucleotidase [Acidiferrobacteraceae bacterium]
MTIPHINWNQLDTLFLDMDGTLLDLNFDNHFWQVHVPKRYGEKHSISAAEAKARLIPRFRAAEGRLDWYCVDYWTDELDMDIAVLKQEVDHLIAVHPDVIEFLTTMRHLKKRLTLVTNAHGKSIDIKMRKTALGQHLDRIISAHDVGTAKEENGFWDQLQQLETFDPARTLLVDDSLPVLRAARNYGIAHLLAIHKPDSQRPINDVEEFDAIHSFAEIMP